MKVSVEVRSCPKMSKIKHYTCLASDLDWIELERPSDQLLTTLSRLYQSGNLAHGSSQLEWLNAADKNPLLKVP